MKMSQSIFCEEECNLEFLSGVVVGMLVGFLLGFWLLQCGDKMNEIYDCSEDRELVMIAKAIDEAMRKSYEVIEAEGYDPYQQQCFYLQ